MDDAKKWIQECQKLGKWNFLDDRHRELIDLYEEIGLNLGSNRIDSSRILKDPMAAELWSEIKSVGRYHQEGPVWMKYYPIVQTAVYCSVHLGSSVDDNVVIF